MLPSSATIQSIGKSVLRKAMAAVIGAVLALVLLTALLITGFYLLVNSATLALAPVLGKPGAMAVTGLACLCLLALFFYRLTRPAKSSKTTRGASPGSDTGSPVDSLRSLIRGNPLEAAALAFAAGVAQQGDPRLKQLLLQGGMILMRQSNVSSPDEGEPAEAKGPAPASGTPPAE